VRTGHSRLGIASFVLSLVSVALFRLLLPVVFISAVSVPEASGEVAVLWARMVTLVQQLALVLGIAGALQRQRKRLLAFIGIAISGLLLALHYF
jgi:hypothetical protein